MVRELVQIGEAALAGGSEELLEALTAPVAKAGRPPKGHEPLLVVLNLKSNPPELEVRPEVLDAKRARRYLWLGNPRANDPKVRITTNRLDYLLGQSFYAIAHDESAPPEILERLGEVFPTLFWTDPTTSGGNRKYAHLLDAPKLGLVDEAAWGKLTQLAPKKRAEELAKALRERFELPKEGVLYTLAINGQPLALLPAYRRYMLEKIVGEAFEDAEEGRCHACGERALVTGNFKHFQLKFFINDKVNFAYGLEEANWPKSYGLCRTCYPKALAGERYLQQHLKVRVLQTATLIVPVLGPGRFAREGLDAMTERLRATANSLEKLESLPGLLDDLEEIGDLPQITLFFVEEAQSATKVRETVPEVEPSWILELLLAFGRTNQQARELFGPPPWGDRGEWLSGTATLLYLLPLGVQKGRPQVGPALEAIKSLLLKEPQQAVGWIRGFLKVARYIYRENPGLYASRNCPETCPEVETALPQMAAWLLFLKEVGLREVSNGMNEATAEGTLQETIRALGLQGEKEALFLLGVLLAQVASEQYKRSKSKPVLEKVGFQGMPIEKVRRFATELFDKLKEYRRLNAASEATFAAAMELLTAHEQNWRLSDEENAFYILLGYGLETRRILNLGAARAKGAEA